jgi:hypothetical protein
MQADGKTVWAAFWAIPFTVSSGRTASFSEVVDQKKHHSGKNVLATFLLAKNALRNNKAETTFNYSLIN